MDHRCNVFLSSHLRSNSTSATTDSASDVQEKGSASKNYNSNSATSGTKSQPASHQVKEGCPIAEAVDGGSKNSPPTNSSINQTEGISDVGRITSSERDLASQKALSAHNRSHSQQQQQAQEEAPVAPQEFLNPTQCDICGNKFASARGVGAHKRRSHSQPQQSQGEEPLATPEFLDSTKCDICDKRFATARGVSAHKSRSHSQPQQSQGKEPLVTREFLDPTKCDICGKRFGTARGVSVHKSRSH